MTQWILGWREFKFFSNEDPVLFSRKDKLQESENTLTKFKNLLLQNQGANFNQTWHKASLGEGDSNLFKWRTNSISKGDNFEIAKITWRNIKFFFSRTTGPISTKLGRMHPWVKGIQVCSNEAALNFYKIDNRFFLLINVMI